MEFILIPITAMAIVGLPIVVAEAVYDFFSNAITKLSAFFNGMQI